MSARRMWQGAALFLLALPAWASQRPQVDLTSPSNGEQFVAGQTVYISATAFSFNGEITQMSAKVDGVTVATVAGDSIDYGWTATLGTHTVSVSAEDVVSMTGTSPSVTITVVQNQMPTVSLTGPANGAVYMAGATVPMTATASDVDGTINRVEFWVDGALVGQDTSSPYAWNWTATAGNHTLQARAVDNANGATTTASTGIYGNVAPAVSLTAPANGAVYTVGTTVPVTANASDSYGGSINRVEFWIDGTLLCQDTASPYACNWAATAGAHSVLAKAVDNLGVTTTTPSIAITGNVLPTVSLTSPANGAVYMVGSAVPMAATASDSGGSIARVEFWVDGTKAVDDTTSPYAYNWTATAGNHTLQAKAVDNYGATTSTSAITITGNVAPTVSLTAPANGAIYTVGSAVPMAATASDSGGSIARVEFWVDGTKAVDDTTSPYAYNWTATAGNHTLQAVAVDNLGAATGTSSITVTGNVLPTVSLTSPANGAVYMVGSAVPMAATASDSGGSIVRVEFWVDGTKAVDDTTSPYAYNWPATAGNHTLQAKAVDNYGATTSTSAITITGNVAPAVSLTAPASGSVYTVGTTVPMTATASDSGGSIARVEFWVDGTKVFDDTASPYAYNWAATAGGHTLQAVAVDNLGAATGSSTVAITGNVLPTVSLTSPADDAVYLVGATVPMAATASDSGGSIVRVEFWVDGTKDVDDTTSPYAYNWTATAGNHTLQAKAVDNYGATTSTSAITITGNVAPTVSLTAPANGAIYTVGSAVPMAATASDSGGSIASVEFWVDGTKVFDDTASPYAYNWTATAGNHTLQAVAVDNLGAATGTSSITVTGNVLPTVSLTSPANGAVYLVGATVPMAANASDSGGTIARVEFWVDVTKVGEDTTSPYSYNWPATAGAHGLTAKAIDNLGGTTTSSTIAMTGNYAPVATLTGPADNSTYTSGTTVPMTATASDNGGSIVRVEFWVDGAKAGEDASSPYAYNWTATAGAHSVLAKAIDNLGSTTSTPAITVNGNAPPTVGLTAPANGASPLVGTYLTLSATASDDGSVTRVEFLVDGTQVGQDYTSPYAYDWPVTAGTHNVQARAIDNLGVTTTTAAIGIFGNQAPTVALTSPAGGAYYAAGATVPLAATAGDADGTIARVEFWVDGAKVADDTSSPYAWNWTMASGSHTLQAKAVDDRGAVTSGGTATIQPLPAGATALTRQYFYNGYQELCGVDEPETGVTLMGFDAAGNLAWSASGLPAGTACSNDGNTTAINARKAARSYDARNRIATLSFPDLNGNQSWSYTPDGLPASVTTYNDGGASSVVNSYLYNRRRLPVSETQQVDSLTSSAGYGYDPNGHLSTLTYPDSLTVAYSPNALGQPTQAGSYATNVTYYPNGAIQQFTYGNGIVHALTQNARGLPDRSQDLNGSTPVHDDSYDYDQAGNVLAISDAVSGNRGDRDMVYDGVNRLTSATSPMFGTATYTYDVVDNLRHVTVTGGTQVRDQDYVYDQNNRLTNITSGGATVVGLGYDVQGNLANKSGVNYTFDYGNRLRAGGPETYRYDVQGRRARSSSSAGLVYSLYAQSGQLLFQRDERSGKRRQYVYLGGSLVAESDVPLAGGTATVTYQHTDALGSPVAVTDANKTVLQRSEYEPYGHLLNRPMEDGPGYTGHVTDAATGLVYMQQRYYDPLCGCFLSTDPVTALGGPFNRYWYANANPYGLVDSDGREPGDPPNNRSPGPIDCKECERRPPPPPPPPRRPCSDACMRLRYTSAHGGSKAQATDAIQGMQSQHGASDSWPRGAEGGWGQRNQTAKYGIAIGVTGGFVAGSWLVAGALAPESGGLSLGANEILLALFELGEPTATIVGAGGLPGAAVGATGGAVAGTVIDQSKDDDKDDKK